MAVKVKKNFSTISWGNPERSRSYDICCWNCSSNITSNLGYGRVNGIDRGVIYICHKCNAPNVLDLNGNNVINSLPGKTIDKLPGKIHAIYNEARACISVEAYTAAVMLFRKILMNLAVEEGAKEGERFIDYVDYLCKENIVHRKQTKQADNIRKMGNAANHEIENRTKEEAFELLNLIELLLLNNYEFADQIETAQVK